MHKYYIGKGKSKVHPRAGHEGPEGQLYSPALSLTSALDGVGGQHHAPAALPPGKTRYPLYRRLGGSQGTYGRVWKISPTTGIRSPDRPSRGELIYRLSYRGPLTTGVQLLLISIENFKFTSQKTHPFPS